MDAAAVAAAAQAANQAASYGAALRLNMANAIASHLAINLGARMGDPTEIDQADVDAVADLAVRLADAVIQRCRQPVGAPAAKRGR